MSFWFIGECLQRAGDGESAVVFPLKGLPDLSRALSQDHLREWVRHLQPDALPEVVDEQAEHYWKLISNLHPEDYVIAVKDKDTLSLGEVTHAYRFEAGESGGHVWPVRWIDRAISLTSFEPLRPLLLARSIKEMPESEARIQFRKYIPSWQTKGYVIFRWVSIILLITELVYFWPRSS